MRYREGTPLVLDGLDFDVPAGSTVGVIGRTGAGKSSLMALLFRLIEPESGSIEIDGVDCASAGLQALRAGITIIPQEPVLMVGSVRHNLDPFGQHSNDAVERALQKAHLPADLIDTPVDHGGSNLSAGERQLLCFARAFLADSAIVIMDAHLWTAC